MGLFDKFFGKKEIADLKKISNPMEEEAFWNIVASSLNNTSNEEEQESFLIRTIGKLSLPEMIGFKLRTDELLAETYTSKMWCAAYVMRGGCSDDAFEYFRNWLISRGKDVYKQAKENPDNLVSQIEEGLNEYEFEGFTYVAGSAFEKKTGKDIYDYIQTDSNAKYPEIDFNWEEENPDSMKALCPRLYEKCWDKW